MERMDIQTAWILPHGVAWRGMLADLWMQLQVTTRVACSAPEKKVAWDQHVREMPRQVWWKQAKWNQNTPRYQGTVLWDVSVLVLSAPYGWKAEFKGKGTVQLLMEQTPWHSYLPHGISVTFHPTPVNTPRLNPSQKAATGFTYTWGMKGWVRYMLSVINRPSHYSVPNETAQMREEFEKA